MLEVTQQNCGSELCYIDLHFEIVRSLCGSAMLWHHLVKLKSSYSPASMKLQNNSCKSAKHPFFSCCYEKKVT